jgi:hypothetical protein
MNKGVPTCEHDGNAIDANIPCPMETNIPCSHLFTPTNQFTNCSVLWSHHCCQIDKPEPHGIDKLKCVRTPGIGSEFECQYYKLERNWNQSESNAQECLNKLHDELLGKDWYIVDPVGGNQGNEIITKEIIEIYKPRTFKEKLLRFFFGR